MPTKNSISANPVGDGFLEATGGSGERTALVLSSKSRAFADGRLRWSAVSAGLMGEMGSLGSGRLSFVPMMKPADLRDRHDATIARRGDRARDRRVLVQRQVRA